MRSSRRCLVTAVALVAVSGVAGCQPKTVVPSTDRAAGPAAGSAAAVLAKLAVKPDGSMSTYNRLKNFGAAWTDAQNATGGHNHCDTRDDILDRDLTAVKRSGKCTVISGSLKDPYTGRTIKFKRGRATSSAVQIDHLVPLGNAWVTGASKLPLAERKELANDPLNLLAADGPANMGKSDDDASEWLPAQKSFDCEYVKRQIAVKSKYHLWVTAKEKAAMQAVLDHCGNQTLSSESSHEVKLKS
ncbi:HNH endonuclease family protein [Streptomyces sp. SL13]|uniref:HNH endonuclease family protein n=1 Tax=Streptantibioticus silvisoli TaxID=2705255 RepID=A0AA90GYY3_9ACTN|nr:HNH endonuclease family protein [Streptantibioticus silvisoli]MDI5962401.1 HNH endonuclease family protein [Streptantibioticus silvisoli]MDI5967913.1 HNH endonuclease family protein [Streptantibioticus silvisoli]